MLEQDYEVVIENGLGKFQFFYNKDGEDEFRHAFMSAEEEAAEYLVEHGIARWAGKNKSAICFNEVQE